MARWTFLTNHAQVLLCVAQNPRMTARQMAGVVGPVPGVRPGPRALTGHQPRA